MIVAAGGRDAGLLAGIEGAKGQQVADAGVGLDGTAGGECEAAGREGDGRCVPEEAPGVGFRQRERRACLGQEQVVVECRAAQGDFARHRGVGIKRLFHAGEADGGRAGIDRARSQAAGAACGRDDDSQVAKHRGVFDGEPVLAAGATDDAAGNAAARAQDESVAIVGRPCQVLET